VVASFVAWTKLGYSTLSPVSTWLGDRLRAGIPHRYVTKPTKFTQPCIPTWSLNQVTALIGWGKGGNVTSAGWQVTLCDPIWHVTSRSGEAVCVLLYTRYLLTYLHCPRDRADKVLCDTSCFVNEYLIRTTHYLNSISVPIRSSKQQLARSSVQCWPKLSKDFSRP